MSALDADEFCADVWPRLVASLTSFTGDRGVGEELAQEALVRALMHWDRVQEMDAPAMWVFRTGLNLARSRWRRGQAERRAQQRLLERPEVAGADVADTLVLRAEIARLPERQRAAVVLRYHADLSVAETATALRCAPGTVKALTSQGLAQLRVRLTDDEIEEVVEP